MCKIYIAVFLWTLHTFCFATTFECTRNTNQTSGIENLKIDTKTGNFTIKGSLSYYNFNGKVIESKNEPGDTLYTFNTALIDFDDQKIYMTYALYNVGKKWHINVARFNDVKDEISLKAIYTIPDAFKCKSY